MKDFNEFLHQQDNKQINHYSSHINPNKAHPDLPPQTSLSRVKRYLIKYSGTFALCLLTGPFNTASVLLQITQKPINNEIHKKIELLGKDNKYVKNGVYGDNKIFKSLQLRGYHDCFVQLGRQGMKGMYKGNLTAILFTLVNTKLRTIFYEQGAIINNFSAEWKKNLLTIFTCTLADFLTLPLMMCQSRLVLQTSFSNFRTYQHPIEILRKTTFQLWFTGASILLLKNMLFTYSWLSFVKESPVYSFIISSILSHVVIYPFNTVIRQLQCNQKSTPMMHDRKQNARNCARRIYKDLGVRGFYRGFIGYGLVHLFFGIIIVDMNLRKGYFQHIEN